MTTSETASSDRFLIVGIGASAGGFDALRRLLQAMPADPPLAIVIVQHLARDRPSLAPELLAKYTSMHLRQVDDEPVVRPGHVYLIPPGKYLRVSSGRLHLSQMEGPRGAPVTIDYFLRSLAQDQGHRAVGAILSGSGSDGVLGIKAIKQAGGFVIAQQVDSAEQTGMPESALQTGLVDRSLTPEEIPEVLVQLAQHDYVCEPSPAGSSEPLDIPREAAADDPQRGLEAILAVVREKTGRDFSSYKHATLVRRSRRRMCLHHTDSFARYAEILEQDETEVRSLARDLLISVTDFFRDREAWEELAQAVIPQIVASKDGSSSAGDKNQPANTVRIWVPGCATGEEAYTVAMLTLDEIRQQQQPVRLQVFASDIDKGALQVAREGRYPTSIAADVSSQQLEQYFSLHDGDVHYQVHQQLRDVVTFAEQDLIGDPPFSQLDLICCRNVLIYLKPSIQTKLLQLFHFAFHADGYLMLGTAETVGRQEELFEPISKRWRIYRSLAPKHPYRLPFPAGIGRSARDLPVTTTTARDIGGMRFTQQRMLQLIAPRGILVDREFRILYISGNVDDYLTFQSGIPSDDLLGKVRDGLRSRLRVAIQTAVAEKRTVFTEAHVPGQETTRPVRIEVRHLDDHLRQESLALVMFDPPRSEGAPIARQQRGAADGEATETPAGPVPGHPDGSPVPDHAIGEPAVVRQLKQELASTKADLRQTIEQFEFSHEEFQASTEELMSVNEELQSTNEELETSKEELQSLNEELSTVNLQLATKVGELETKHADLENLISATRVATICLDSELLIRWFTEAVGEVIRIKSADIGRPLSDLQHDFVENDLVAECRQVLKTLTPIDREVPCLDGRTFLRRIVPYRADPQRIAGLVITMLDISSRIAREAELWASEEKLRLAAEAARLGWYSYDVQHDVSVWSPELRAVVGVDDHETITRQRALELVHPDDRQAYAQQLQDSLNSPQNSQYRGEFRCLREDGTELWLEERRKVIWNDLSADDPQPLHAVGMVMDITERKAAESQLQDSYEWLEQQIAERTRVLETLQKVTRIANESVLIQGTVHAVLQQLTEFNGYKVGHVHLIRKPQNQFPAGSDSAEFFGDALWYVQDEEAPPRGPVRDAHDRSDLLAKLRQQVVESGRPTWIADLEAAVEGEKAARELVSLGIRSLTLAPVSFQKEVIAVVLLFGNDICTPSETFRDLLVDAGIQLGHAIARQRLQQVVGRIADEEQRRIGRELHDTIAQQLTGGALVAQALKGSLSGEETARQQTVDQLIEIFSAAHRGVRELSTGLMHNAARADDLVSVLQSICGEVTRRFDVGCELLVEEFEACSIQNESAAMAIVQIAREAIHNAVKHASATQIDVELATRADEVRLVVGDDGVGMAASSPDRSTNGLHIMRFRADSLGGDLQLISPEMGGTSVILTLPKSSCQR